MLWCLSAVEHSYHPLFVSLVAFLAAAAASLVCPPLPSAPPAAPAAAAAAAAAADCPLWPPSAQDQGLTSPDRPAALSIFSELTVDEYNAGAAGVHK
jgi:hypothetical protein